LSGHFSGSTTSIDGISRESPFISIVRNPKPFLEGLKKAGGIRAIKNSLDTLKTTQKPVTGRMNSETLIFIVL